MRSFFCVLLVGTMGLMEVQPVGCKTDGEQWEHPRLLVSAKQRPGLRRRAATPEGRKLLGTVRHRLGKDQKHTASDDAIGHGFVYALTRDNEHADAAMQVIEQWIDHPDAGAQTGDKAAVAVLAWDLIHDACDPVFNKRMVQAIEANYQRLADIEGVNPNRSMASNFNARWRPALGLMALAVLDEPTADQEKAREMLAFAKEHVAGYLTSALGKGGWNAEGDHYTNWSLRSALMFVHAYRNCTGEDLLEDDENLANYLPLLTMRTVFREEGVFVPSLGVGLSGLYFHRDILAMAYPLVPEKYKPGVLWHWNRIRQMPDSEVGRLCSHSAGSAVWELLHYPPDDAAANPAEAFPKVWADREKGVYFFRSGWSEPGVEEKAQEDRLQTGHEMLAVFHAKHPPLVGGWKSANAGVFRIYGLGHPWVVRGLGGKVGHWSTDNVVMTNDVPAATEGGTGVTTTTTDHHASDDGSGTVTVDMKGLYGKSANRSFLVDYSGRSGAAGLFALHDRIEGDGKKTWQIWVAGEVKIEGNTFLLHRQDSRATLQGTIITPTDAKLTATSTRNLWVINPTDNSARKTNNRVLGRLLWPNRSREVSHVIRAESSAKEFLVVMTLQEGDAPDVAVRKGDSLTVQVGDLAVRIADGCVTVEADE